MLSFAHKLLVWASALLGPSSPFGFAGTDRQCFVYLGVQFYPLTLSASLLSVISGQ